MGQDNRFIRYPTIDEAHTIVWELHERIGGGHFVADIIANKILDVGYRRLKLFHDALNFVDLVMHAKELEV
jgi:hypothetical protein